MIDIRRLRFDGKFNYHNGLRFYFKRHGHVISFLVQEIGDRKRKIKVTMHPDPNHDRAHVHIGEHGASFALDTGELLAGECDNRTRQSVQKWIHEHKEDLLSKKWLKPCTLVQLISNSKNFCNFAAWQITEMGHIV